MTQLKLELGVKADPIEYRYSYEWLFRLMQEEGVRYLQLGTFFEIYQLPDDFFRRLRRQAADFDVEISSVFTTHRELGGFFREEPGFVAVARRNYERLIEVAALVGAKSIGSNPGAVLRDRMGGKRAGLECYLQHMQELMLKAGRLGVEWLAIEPMSCLAEPPTLPEENRAMAAELAAYRQRQPEASRAGYCVDVAHGYLNRAGEVVANHLALMQSCLPWTHELHLKNTDARYDSTFGFTEKDRARGIIDLGEVREFYQQYAAELPVTQLIGYLEIGGPKTGRDYSDCQLEGMLRDSLRHARSTFLAAEPPAASVLVPALPPPVADLATTAAVKIAPSIMCCDHTHFEESVRRLESSGMELLHVDVMDAKFAPNLPLGLDTIRQLRARTGLAFDVHLMVEDNDFFVRECAKIGVERIAVHAESCPHLDRTLCLIRDLGMKAGVALNPATPMNAVEYELERLDFILLMTVNPGFAGQKLVPGAMRKIRACREFLDARGFSALSIEVDGNVSFENIPEMVANGADVLVAGSSSIFHPGGTLAENAARTRAAIAQGLKRRNVNNQYPTFNIQYPITNIQ